jgi:HEPN domain-containing protein
MVDRRLIIEWLAKADEDYGFASSVIKDSVYYGQICFHYQQAAEKYLKAFIVAHELLFEKIHDLLILLSVCSRKEPTLTEMKNDCTFLNRFYINTRYPVHWPTNHTMDDAFSAQKAAQNIGNTIKKLLEPGA